MPVRGVVPIRGSDRRDANTVMLLLVSGATATVKKWRQVGELIVPGAGNAPESLKLVPGMWAMDNGAYSGFEADAFMRMLERYHTYQASHGSHGCLWVSCPDVVADAYATLQLWPFWSRVIRGVGFRPALVLQDGMLASEVPWKELGAVFVGGSTAWKFSPQAHELVAYARARGLWVHVGRVNSRKRIYEAYRMGAQSFDGGQYSMFADRRIPEGVADVEAAQLQPRLVS